MTENQAAAEAAFDSTVITGEAMPENAISDAAFNAPAEEVAPVEAPATKPVSTREAIEKALEETEAKEDKPVKAEEPEKTAKPRADDGKFAAKATKDAAEDAAPGKPVDAAKSAAEKPAGERDDSEHRQSESRKFVEPPARFLPEARTKWANVPNEIKSEFHRVSEEYEREVAEHRQFREELREYEDLAKQHGVTIKDTMQRYVEADRVLNQNFGQGVAQMAQMYGHNPAQAIAAVMQGFGITPQQYIQAVTQNPQLAQAPMPSQMQQQRAPEPRQQQIDPQQLTQQIKEQLRAEMSAEQTVSYFAQTHPDFADLSGHIKGILDSGVLERLYGQGLTQEQKLAEAYRMAGGSGPASNQTQAAPAAHSEYDATPVNLEAGTKSIRGAPAAGTDNPNRRFKSNRDAAAAALAEVGI